MRVEPANEMDGIVDLHAVLAENAAEPDPDRPFSGSFLATQHERDFGAQFRVADNMRTGCFRMDGRSADSQPGFILRDPEEETCQYAVSCSSIAGTGRRL